MDQPIFLSQSACNSIQKPPSDFELKFFEHSHIPCRNNIFESLQYRQHTYNPEFSKESPINIHTYDETEQGTNYLLSMITTGQWGNLLNSIKSKEPFFFWQGCSVSVQYVKLAINKPLPYFGCLPIFHNLNSQKENIVEGMEILFALGANPNIVDPIEKQTILSIIANSIPLHNNHQTCLIKIVQIILKNGGNPNFVEKHGTTPFLSAIKKGNITIVKEFINNHAEFDKEFEFKDEQNNTKITKSPYNLSLEFNQVNVFGTSTNYQQIFTFMNDKMRKTLSTKTRQSKKPTNRSRTKKITNTSPTVFGSTNYVSYHNSPIVNHSIQKSQHSNTNYYLSQCSSFTPYNTRSITQKQNDNHTHNMTSFNSKLLNDPNGIIRRLNLKRLKFETCTSQDDVIILDN